MNGPMKPYAEKPKGVGVCPKVYLVFLPINVAVAQGKQPDDYLLAAKLTNAAAERVRAEYPGAYIVKTYATKI